MLRGDQPERVIAGAAKICWVDPGVSMGGLAPGKTVTATGYQEHGTGRWIVTRLTHG